MQFLNTATASHRNALAFATHLSRAPVLERLSASTLKPSERELLRSLRAMTETMRPNAEHCRALREVTRTLRRLSKGN